MRRLVLLAVFSPLALALAAGGAGCAGDPSDDEPIEPTSDPTYWTDVKPIIDAKCGGCHVEEGIAPFALQTYEDAAAHAGVSKLALMDGIMPPWPPDDACNDYRGNRSLTDEQLETFLAWVDAGALEGDPADEGEAIVEDVPQLSRVDLSMTMAEAYTPGQEPDDYRCFLLPWPEEYTDTRYVTGFRAVPGNDAIVHHVIAFLATADQAQVYYDLDAAEEGPGYTCFGGTGGPARGWVGGWAPGSLGSDLPEGTGIAIEPGSMIILQVHYNVLESDPAADTTSIDLKIDDTVAKEAQVLPWANPQWLGSDAMLIPAGESDVMHEWAFDPTVFMGMDGMEIHTVGLHQHTLGTRSRLSIERADGTSDCALDIPRWDFDWQGSYELEQPMTLESGDQLRIECHWDNTAANQPVVDGSPLPPRDVTWGEGTTDEMCLGLFLVTEP